MTDKEKLEKALVHLKKFIDGDCVITQEILSDFPELEDSKDESIRKAIVKTIKESPVIGVGEFSKNDMLAYLEKQKENTEELVYRLNRLMQEYINERKDEAEQEHRFKCYKLFWDALEDASYFDEQKEPKPISFNESYNPDDYEVVMEGNATGLKRKEQKPVEVKDPSMEELEAHNKALHDFKVFAAKQAKEHHISFVHDFEWNNFCGEILSYFNQPVEWSEEDEKMMADVLESLRKYQLSMPNYQVELQMRWLKSLRLRPHWKPSEEQMEALLNTLHPDDPYYNELKSLYEQLQKL